VQATFTLVTQTMIATITQVHITETIVIITLIRIQVMHMLMIATGLLHRIIMFIQTVQITITIITTIITIIIMITHTARVITTNHTTTTMVTNTIQGTATHILHGLTK